MAGRIFERPGYPGTWYLRVSVPTVIAVKGGRRATQKVGPRPLAEAVRAEVDGLIQAALMGEDPVRAHDVLHQAWSNLRGRHPGASPEPATLTVDDYAPSWLSTVSGSTARLYAGTYHRHIATSFGSMPLGAVRPRLVREWVQGLEREYKPRTVKTYLSVLRAMFGQAVRDEEIRANPASDIRRRRHQDSEMRVLEHAELAHVIRTLREHARGDDRGLCIEVMAATGCRIGEAVALQWGDLRDGELTVRRQIHKGKVGATKNRKVRRVRLAPSLRAALRAHRVGQQERALARGRRAGKWMFSHDGKPWSDQSVRRVWQDALVAAGLLGKRQTLRSQQLGPHVLRHTRASHWLAAGEPATDVASWLGDSVETVLRVYAHALPRNRDGSQVDLDALVRGAE